MCEGPQLFFKSQLAGALEPLVGVRWEGNSLNRPVALGFWPVESNVAWVIFGFHAEAISSVEIKYFDKPLTDPDRTLGVEISVVATETHWEAMRAHGHQGVVTASDNGGLVIGGKLPYFIRHVRSIVELLALVAARL